MPTAYSPLLGLALPVQGELSGTWGDTVNNYITTYLDAAIAGAQALSTDADVTLTKTTGATLTTASSQYAILNCTGARTVLRTITAPAASKAYLIINGTTGGFGVKLVGAGPTAGVTIPASATALVAWNGSDFVVVAQNNLTTNYVGALPVANGGSGVATLTGLAYGNGTSAFTAATAAQIVAAISTTAVTNATNATNLTGSGTVSATATGGAGLTPTTATNATNVAIAADTTTAATFYIPYASATTGNVGLKGTRLTVTPSTGDFTAAGNVTAYSDERLKTNWQTLDANILTQLAGVKTGTYDRTDTDQRQIGVSAQSLAQVMPEAIHAGEDGMLAVAYGNAALAAAVMLARKVQELEARLAKLEA